MTTSGYPSDATDQLVQANIVAAEYDVQQLRLTSATASAAPPDFRCSRRDPPVTRTRARGRRGSTCGVLFLAAALAARLTLVGLRTVIAGSQCDV